MFALDGVSILAFFRSQMLQQFFYFIEFATDYVFSVYTSCNRTLNYAVNSIEIISIEMLMHNI